MGPPQRIQKTLKKAGSLSGIGIHSGERATVFFKPAPIHTGIRFFRSGRSAERPRFVQDPRGFSEESLRATSLGSGETQIQTVEHVWAAFCGLGITNVLVEVQGPEIPVLDGSALPFAEFFLKLGIAEQKATLEVYRVKEPVICFRAKRAIAIYPDEELRIAYILDYDHPLLKRQKVDFTITERSFLQEIAPARTFCTKEEAEILRKRGLGRGADYRNTLVMGKKGAVRNRLRFADECARHKVLDVLGDLGLLGFPVLGRIVGLRSGHALNHELIERIRKQKEVL